MVKRIVVLNSDVYGKASIRLDDCNSIQLVGPNNIGKSTLIYTLNFLFIIDGKKMSFSGNRSEKDTLHHYFPSQTNSYLIFEIFKQNFYSILVKRGEDGLEYYRIDNEYNEDLFLETKDKQQKVLKFDDVKEKMAAKGIELYQFKDKKEVFGFIYQRGKRNNAAVWLEDTVVTDGLSNNFSKVYRYLINSKLINNKTLKDTLIIADNRDKEGLNFSQKDKKDISNLLKANDEIKAFESIKEEFFHFRETVNKHKGKEQIVRELISAFNKQYSFSKVEFESKVKSKKEESDKITFRINEELAPQQQKLDREIGGLESLIATNNATLEKIEKQLKEINGFEGRDFIKQAIVNTDKKRKELEAKLTQIDTKGLNLKNVEKKVESLKSLTESKAREITNFSKRLIQNIAGDQKTKEQVNYILSEEFLSALTKADVSKQITKVTELMALFDGKIKIDKDIPLKPIASLEELNEELKLLKAELTDNEKMLVVMKDVESKRTELAKLKISLEEFSEKIKKIDTKPQLENELSKYQGVIKQQSAEKDTNEKRIKLLIDEITQKSELIRTLTEDKKDFEARLNTILDQKFELEQMSLEPVDFESQETLENIYKKIRLFNTERLDLKLNKDKTFDKLRDKIKSNIADEKEFIDYVNEEIDCLQDKRNSIDGYLQAISVQFANPAASLIRRYAEFKEFVYNKFNSKLSKTKFSDIESLKIELLDSTSIMDDLRKISAIQDLNKQTELDFGQTDNLLTLNKYLDSGKKIDFDELFDIELHLHKGGKERKVDLKDQVESDGTDRMIRLIIVMSVINRLAINDKDNKIVIFIDEIATIDGNNRKELFKFCKEHNFIPICASPDETILDGFDKYVLLFRPQKGGKVNINEKHPNVIFQERLLTEPSAN